MKPFFTILTATLNSEKTIKRTITSVFSQTFCDYEYLIVDGASTDKTLDIIEEAAAENPRLKLLRTQPDSCPLEAYNFAIDHANGAYIFMLSGDDWVDGDLLENVYKLYLKQTQKPDIFSIQSIAYELNNKKFSYLKSWPKEDFEFTFKNILKLPFTNSRFYKKDIFDKVGKFMIKSKNKKIMLATDYEFLIRLALYKPKIKAITTDFNGVNLLLHEESISGSRNVDKNLAIQLEHIEILLQTLRNTSLTYKKPILHNIIIEKYLICFYYSLLKLDIKNSFKYFSLALRVNIFTTIQKFLHLSWQISSKLFKK